MAKKERERERERPGRKATKGDAADTDAPTRGRKTPGPQAESVMSGLRVMKTAQSPLGAARAVSSPLLKRHTPVLLTPIPTANPFNLRIINDRNALIILGLPWQTRRASFTIFESRVRGSFFHERSLSNRALQLQLKNYTVPFEQGKTFHSGTC